MCPGCAGPGFLSSQSVVFFVWCVTGVSRTASSPGTEQIKVKREPRGAKMCLPLRSRR